MRYTMFAAAIATVALSACGPADEPDEPTAGDQTTVPAPAPAAEQSPQPVGAPSEDAEPLPDTLPRAFHGRWGLVRADCTSTMGDAKGLLEISADQLDFYESVGTLQTISEAAEDKVRGEFAFTGEGMAWTREILLVLRDGGKTLVRREFGTDASPQAFGYTRCS